MAAVNYTNIYAEARDILTGDPDSLTPTDGQLQRKAQAAVRSIMGTWSCISDGAGGVNLTGDELAAFERAMGYRTANLLLGGPLGKTYAAAIEERSGRVTIKRSGTLTLQDFMDEFDDCYAEQLRLISCIGGSIPGPSAMVARSGVWVNRREQRLGHPANLVEAAFGPEDEDR